MKRWLVIALLLTGAVLATALMTWHGVFGPLPERVTFASARRS